MRVYLGYTFTLSLNSASLSHLFRFRATACNCARLYVGALPPRALLIRPAIAVLGLVSLNV
jgi:hypothetical protein